MNDEELRRRFLKLKEEEKKPLENKVQSVDIAARFKSIAGKDPVIHQADLQTTIPKTNTNSNGLYNDLEALKGEFKKQLEVNSIDIEFGYDEDISELMEQACTELLLETTTKSLMSTRQDELQSRLQNLLRDGKGILGAKYAMDSDELEMISAENTTHKMPERKQTKLVKRGTCCICLESGYCKCHDCDGDVYCLPCWNECHQSNHPEMSTHKYKSFI